VLEQSAAVRQEGCPTGQDPGFVGALVAGTVGALVATAGALVGEAVVGEAVVGETVVG
jgi:hypothetical protein